MPAADSDFEDLLSEPFDDTLPNRLSGLLGDAELDTMAWALPLALRGNIPAARQYVDAYRQVARRLLEAAAQARPELVRVDADEVVVKDQSGHQAGFVLQAMEQTAAEAPFSRWAALRGIKQGVMLHALASLRSLLPDTQPLEPPVVSGVLPISELDTRRFLAAVRRSLNAGQPPLDRIRDTFDLNNTELGRLFGVTRQAVQDWARRGVPSDRQDKVTAVAAIADLLERKLKADRIPGVVRRPAAAYDGHSMLDLIAADRHQELLEITRRSFDWATAA